VGIQQASEKVHWRGNDLPIDLLEDVIAIGDALLIGHATSVS
jgi:hypothetical protein